MLNEVTVDGKTSRLTPTESNLLQLLVVNANNVCTVGQIASHIWGFANNGDAELIKAHIRHLRQKIEPNPGTPRFILTVPVLGYALVSCPGEEYDAREVSRNESQTILT